MTVYLSNRETKARKPLSCDLDRFVSTPLTGVFCAISIGFQFPLQPGVRDSHPATPLAPSAARMKSQTQSISSPGADENESLK